MLLICKHSLSYQFRRRLDSDILLGGQEHHELWTPSILFLKILVIQNWIYFDAYLRVRDVKCDSRSLHYYPFVQLIFVYLNSDSWIICVPNLQIGDEFDLGKGFVIKAFKTYHVVPSQVQTMQICQDSNHHYKVFLPICIFLPISVHSGSQCTSNIRIPCCGRISHLFSEAEA